MTPEEWKLAYRIDDSLNRIANALETLVHASNRQVLNLSPAEEAIVTGESQVSPEGKIAPKEPEKPATKTNSSLPWDKIANKHLIGLFKEYSVGKDLWAIYQEIQQRQQDGKLTEKEVEQFYNILTTDEKTQEIVLSQVAAMGN